MLMCWFACVAVIFLLILHAGTSICLLAMSVSLAMPAHLHIETCLTVSYFLVLFLYVTVRALYCFFFLSMCVCRLC